jgi:hypothetical protein
VSGTPQLRIIHRGRSVSWSGLRRGGPTDNPARFIAERLGPALGEHVIVETGRALLRRLPRTT